MNWSDRISLFSTLDFVALAILFAAWALLNHVIENPPKNRISVSAMMAQHRLEWMETMITRQPRVFDGMILGNMRQGTTFFASTTIIAIGGILALLGNIERFAGVASDLTLDQAPTIVWELKLLIMLFFLANAFLKFVWAHRLFGYGSILMATVPNDPDDPLCGPRARQAGEINNTSARSFNKGLRSVYFALTSTVWFIGAGALIVAVAVTSLVLLRREFASRSREILLQAGDTQT